MRRVVYAFFALAFLALVLPVPVLLAKDQLAKDQAAKAQAFGQKPESNALILQADFSGVVMTGVAYSVSNALDIYNIRPLIPLYDIRAASASLAYNAQTWPAGSVFVSVVDPGVGTSRKSVVLKTNNGLYFVSPDNGSLSGPAKAYGVAAVREIDESVNRRPDTDWAHTFHGRDVYSYTGARLAAGVISFRQVGSLLAPKVIELDRLDASYENGVLSGFVSGGTGRLGNIEFSIDRSLFENSQANFDDLFDVVIKHHDKTVWKGSLPYARSFGDVAVGDNLLFINSSGDLSIAINQGNFAEKYDIDYGEDWHIELVKRAGAEKLRSFKFKSVDTHITSRGVSIPLTYVFPFVTPGESYPLVVMAHGHGGTRHEAGGFTGVAEGLAARGIASVRMDFPGCGESTESFVANNLSNMLRDIQSAREFVLTKIPVNKNRVGLLGYSMGGRLALLLASMDKSYQVIATWAPSATNGVEGIVPSLGGAEAYNNLKLQAGKEGFAPYTTAWGQDQKLGEGWFIDMEESMPLESIKNFTGQLLVLHGDMDDIVEPVVAEAVVAAARNSIDTVHHVIAGAGHGLGLYNGKEKITEEAVNITVNFLSQRL
ncbi:MAG: SAM-dependent chlorinase/fluorinase [Pseudomonadales bacterium]|nr:SAM-dependent chlorinase/fluorinase [Pseudomonadales bacterium]